MPGDCGDRFVRTTLGNRAGQSPVRRFTRSTYPSCVWGVQCRSGVQDSDIQSPHQRGDRGNTVLKRHHSKGSLLRGPSAWTVRNVSPLWIKKSLILSRRLLFTLYLGFNCGIKLTVYLNPFLPFVHPSARNPQKSRCTQHLRPHTFT